MVSGLVKVGFFYLVMRFFFPRVFLTPEPTYSAG